MTMALGKWCGARTEARNMALFETDFDEVWGPWHTWLFCFPSGFARDTSKSALEGSLKHFIQWENKITLDVGGIRPCAHDDFHW